MGLYDVPLSVFNDSIWCMVNLHKNMKLLVGVCYRSPSSGEENNRELAVLITARHWS